MKEKYNVRPNERARLERCNYEFAKITSGCIYEALDCFRRASDAGEDTDEFRTEIASMKDYLALGFTFAFAFQRECSDFKLDRFLVLTARASAGNLGEYRKGKYDDLLRDTVRQARKTLAGFDGRWSEKVRIIFERLFDKDPKLRTAKKLPSDDALKRAAKRAGIPLSRRSGRPRKTTTRTPQFRGLV